MILPDRIRRIGVAPSVTAVGASGSLSSFLSGIDSDQYILLPGFCDVHVHFREPGFSYKETIRTGAASAAAAGVTAVCTMPNLNPVPDSVEHLQPQLDKISEVPVRVLPYGSITVGEKGSSLSDLEGLAPYVAAFSDDGVGVADEGIMREAMQRCKALGKLIAGHCEDMRFEDPREREWREIERNILLADETGCPFHVCHISTTESVSLIREAKKSHLDISCETAPHYLLLDDTQLEDSGRFKMNPPIHKKADREALLQALTNGTIDMVATDHAPHSAEEKSRGFAKSLNGIVGLETAFPALYTGLVLNGLLTLGQLVELMAISPRRRFGIPIQNDYALWDLGTEYTMDPNRFYSMGRSTPFEGWNVRGRCMMTAIDETVVYCSETLKFRS